MAKIPETAEEIQTIPVTTLVNPDADVRKVNQMWTGLLIVVTLAAIVAIVMEVCHFWRIVMRWLDPPPPPPRAWYQELPFYSIINGLVALDVKALVFN